jgi:aldo/keto reductase family protein
VIATEFGLVQHGDGARRVGVLDSSPRNVRAAVEGSLTRLGTDHIDLYYQHRVDLGTPIEDTVGGLAELVTEGEIRYIGRRTGSVRVRGSSPLSSTPITRPLPVGRGLCRLCSPSSSRVGRKWPLGTAFRLAAGTTASTTS